MSITMPVTLTNSYDGSTLKINEPGLRELKADSLVEYKQSTDKRLSDILERKIRFALQAEDIDLKWLYDIKYYALGHR